MAFSAYQPLNALARPPRRRASEVRNWSVPAGFHMVHVLNEVMRFVRYVSRKCGWGRSGYHRERLRHRKEGRTRRLGKSEFAVGVDISRPFTQAAARPLRFAWNPRRESNQDWADLLGVSREMPTLKDRPIPGALRVRASASDAPVAAGDDTKLVCCQKRGDGVTQHGAKPVRS